MGKEEVFELSLEEKWRSDTQRAYSTILKMGDIVKMISEETVRPLLGGAVDIHVHA